MSGLEFASWILDSRGFLVLSLGGSRKGMPVCFFLPQLAQGNISMDHPSPRVHPKDRLTGTSLAQILLVYNVHEGWEGGEGP